MVNIKRAPYAARRDRSKEMQLERTETEEREEAQVPLIKVTINHSGSI